MQRGINEVVRFRCAAASGLFLLLSPPNASVKADIAAATCKSYEVRGVFIEAPVAVVWEFPKAGDPNIVP